MLVTLVLVTISKTEYFGGNVGMLATNKTVFVNNILYNIIWIDKRRAPSSEKCHQYKKWLL